MLRPTSLFPPILVIPRPSPEAAPSIQPLLQASQRLENVIQKAAVRRLVVSELMSSEVKVVLMPSFPKGREEDLRRIASDLPRPSQIEDPFLRNIASRLTRLVGVLRNQRLGADLGRIKGCYEHLSDDDDGIFSDTFDYTSVPRPQKVAELVGGVATFFGLHLQPLLGSHFSLGEAEHTTVVREKAGRIGWGVTGALKVYEDWGAVHSLVPAQGFLKPQFVTQRNGLRLC